EGQAPAPAAGEKPARAALRRLGGRDRPPRSVAALPARDGDRAPRRGRRHARARAGAGLPFIAGVRTGPRRGAGAVGGGGDRVSDRMRRVNESLRKVLADGVERLGDPSVGFVTVTGV